MFGFFHRYLKNLTKNQINIFWHTAKMLRIVQGVWFFTDTVWILGPHGQAKWETFYFLQENKERESGGSAKTKSGLSRQGSAKSTRSAKSAKSVAWSTAGKDTKYCKVASSNTSRFEAHVGFFRLLMKGIVDPYAGTPEGMWTWERPHTKFWQPP